MEQSLAKSETQPRKLSREARRLQLIEATIETLAVRGYARTTLTDVANHAGLSHGLVNFHFETKEKLLTETLNYLADEYTQNWQSALAGAGPEAARQLDALIRADFNPALCTTTRLSAWCAFWGEAQCRPLYQEHCGANDEAYFAQLVTLCAAIRDDGDYDLDPKVAARVLRVALEGIWLEMMTMSTPYSLEEARGTAYACVAAFFPRHFDGNGLTG